MADLQYKTVLQNPFQVQHFGLGLTAAENDLKAVETAALLWKKHQVLASPAITSTHVGLSVLWNSKPGKRKEAIKTLSKQGFRAEQAETQASSHEVHQDCLMNVKKTPIAR